MHKIPVLIMKSEGYIVKVYHYKTLTSEKSFEVEEFGCTSYEEAVLKMSEYQKVSDVINEDVFS